MASSRASGFRGGAGLGSTARIFQIVSDTARAQQRSAGYAALEALMALLILSLSLSFGLMAYGQADRAAAAALEINRARGLIDDLLATAPNARGELSGTSGGFSWTSDLQDTASGGLVEVCRRSVSVVSAKSSRRYDMAQLQACPVEAGQ